ncbi:MAG: gamma-glutamyltransferase family protein [Thermoplasmatales archaeon]|nr:gamma-glutamyltransferase family protein [Thermoplasmatales archaeon]MCW6169798.1 gamma-glutamyltransferase family protein [Thermoplasmatales archaeon]
MKSQTRPDAYSQNAVVSSSSLQASIIGSNIIREGGNVFDAAIATSAALCVTQNNLCGLGGDMFALVRVDGEPIIDINGSGRSSHNAAISNYTERGLNHIPERGPLSALTVPGLVSGWKEIFDKYCSFDLPELIAPAIDLAENGFPITLKYRESVEKSYPALSRYNWSSLFAPNSVFPAIGSVFKQPLLAGSLKLIAEEGPNTFYRGYLADKIISGLKGTEVMLDEEDFKAHKVTIGKPMSTEYHEHTIYETSPNSQGSTLLLWLDVLKLIEENGANNRSDNFSQDLLAGIIAYRQRKEITDPDFYEPPKYFLTRKFSEKILKENNKIMEEENHKHSQGDTTYFCIADSDGNSISMIQSNYLGFGSGVSPEGTGFILQNRGSYFSLDKAHKNVLEPNKRTFHTLSAAMIEYEGKFRFSLGTMGGDIQPQIHFQLIQDLLRSKMSPQTALDSPRWAFPHTIYEQPRHIIIEEEAFDRLSSMNLHGLLPVKKESLSSLFGHAQIVGLDSNDVVCGGADPRGDGAAIPVT